MEWKNKSINLNNLILLLLIIIISFGSRLVDHPANFTALGALALFSGAIYKSRWGILLPLGVMLISDVIIGFYSWQIMLSVYISFALIYIIGKAVYRNKNTVKIVLGSLTGAILFYLVTNWAVWLFSPWYAPTLGGLLESYYLALPFFRNMLAGDLTYALTFYASYKILMALPEKRLLICLARQTGI